MNNNCYVKNDYPKPYKCLIFIAGFYVMLDICCNLFANKIILLPFGFISAVTITSALGFMCGDIIAEVYGYKMTILMYIYSTLCKFIIFPFLSIAIHSNFINNYESHNYNIVLDHSLTRSIIVFICSLIAMYINSYLIVKWKMLLRGKYFWLRSTASSAIGEIIFVVLTILFFFTFVNNYFLNEDILIVYLLSSCAYRILFTAIAAFPSTIIVAILKKIENVDVHAPMQNFNPFLKEAGLHKDKNF